MPAQTMPRHASAGIWPLVLVMIASLVSSRHEGWAAPYELELGVHAEDAFEIVEVVEGDEVSFNEVGAGQVLFPVVRSATTSRPAGSAWDFVGVSAGQTYWRLPKDQDPSLLWLSVGTEDLAPADFASQITLSLVSVTGTGGGSAPGIFSVWDGDELTPVPLMSSFGGAPGSLSVAPGTHNHFNYGFTAPGLYNVTLAASGTLSAGLGGGAVTGLATYTFGVFDQDDYPALAVTPYTFSGVQFPYYMYENAHADIGLSLMAVPEPATVGLAAVGGGLLAGLAAGRRRRQAASGPQPNAG